MKSVFEDSQDDDFVGDFELLNEEDIPGASLDGKNPQELNVTQLRHWLTCRGAPVGGKKPKLVEWLAITFDIMISV